MRKFVGMLKDPKCNGADLANEASRMCNVLRLDTEKTVTEVREDNESSEIFLNQIALPWVIKLNEMAQSEKYDDRNEMSVTIGAAFYRVASQLEYLPCRLTAWSKDFVEGMSREHRTIQQTFSGIVFLYLAKELEERGTLPKVDEFMSLEGFPYGLWREGLPLI